MRFDFELSGGGTIYLLRPLLLHRWGAFTRPLTVWLAPVILAPESS